MITSVGQGYKLIEGKQDYKTGLRITYGERKASIDIGKAKDNYDKDEKPKCFNCNIYKHIAKNCRKPKKEKETRKYYKYNKVKYLVKNCRLWQKMKNRSVQDTSDNEDKENNDKEKGFVRDSE